MIKQFLTDEEKDLCKKIIQGNDPQDYHFNCVQEVYAWITKLTTISNCLRICRIQYQNSLKHGGECKKTLKALEKVLHEVLLKRAYCVYLTDVLFNNNVYVYPHNYLENYLKIEKCTVRQMVDDFNKLIHKKGDDNNGCRED